MALRPADDLFDDLPTPMALHSFLGLLLAMAVGALAAVALLPVWLPGLSASLLGPSPKAFWYLSRASAFVAFALLWLSMVFGLLATSRAARLWPGGPIAFDLHQHASLLGTAFALFHGLILLGDRYMNASLAQLLVPFANAPYRPLWVGLGQLAFYTMLVVGLSFYVRRAIGARLWRLVHFASFAVFLASLLHGLASGTDTAAVWARAIYWVAGASVLFLTVYRVLVVALVTPARAARTATLAARLPNAGQTVPTASLMDGTAGPPTASRADRTRG